MSKNVKVFGGVVLFLLLSSSPSIAGKDYIGVDSVWWIFAIGVVHDICSLSKVAFSTDSEKEPVVNGSIFKLMEKSRYQRALQR